MKYLINTTTDGKKSLYRRLSNDISTDCHHGNTLIRSIFRRNSLSMVLFDLASASVFVRCETLLELLIVTHLGFSIVVSHQLWFLPSRIRSECTNSHCSYLVNRISSQTAPYVQIAAIIDSLRYEENYLWLVNAPAAHRRSRQNGIRKRTRKILSSRNSH
jgi:hypothetical protein